MPKRKPAVARDDAAVVAIIDRPCGFCHVAAGTPCTSVGGHALLYAHRQRIGKRNGTREDNEAALSDAYARTVVALTFGRCDDALLARAKKEQSIDVRKSWVKKAMIVDEGGFESSMVETTAGAPEFAPGILVYCECGCPRHIHRKLAAGGQSGSYRAFASPACYGECTSRHCRAPLGKCQDFKAAPEAVQQMDRALEQIARG